MDDKADEIRYPDKGQGDVFSKEEAIFEASTIICAWAANRECTGIPAAKKIFSIFRRIKK